MQVIKIYHDMDDMGDHGDIVVVDLWIKSRAACCSVILVVDSVVY